MALVGQSECTGARLEVGEVMEVEAPWEVAAAT
jgi:hypothetical protein